MSMADGKEVPIVYETEGFFTFHHVNTYEQDGYVIADICAYKNANVSSYLESVRKINHANFNNRIQFIRLDCQSFDGKGNR